MFKLVALDMDGTLLNSNHAISEENHAAIQKAKEKGVKVVLATGRPINGIKNFLHELNLVSEDDYAVAYGGALVQNTKNGTVLSQNLMTLEDWNYLSQLASSLGVNVHALSKDACITPKDNKYSNYEATMNGIPLIINNPSEMEEEIPLVKIMFIDEPEILAEAISKLPEEIYEKYTVVRSAPFYLEFLNKKVNKATGIEVLAQSLNIKKEEIICIGDAGNDIHMIQYAGLGVAMDNAFPEVKKVANYITLSNDNHGVAHVIDKFIINPKFQMLLE